MRFSDPVIGAASIAFGAVVAFGASQLPPARHLDFGPGFLPSIVAIGLIACGLLLILRDVVENGIPKFFIERPTWIVGEARRRMLLLAAGIAVYPLLLPQIGFFLTTVLSLILLLRAGKVGWRFTLFMSVAAALGCQVLFAMALRVPLPGPSIEFLINLLPNFLAR